MPRINSELLDNTFYKIDNPDKETHEKWGDENHPLTSLMNQPSPFRWMIAGTPNSGKTLMILNLLVKLRPHPATIYLLHAETFDPDLYSVNNEVKDFIGTQEDYPVKEYKRVDYIPLLTLPPYKWFVNNLDTKSKKVLIIDDVDLKEFVKLNKSKNMTLGKIFTWVSTHRNMSIFAAFQNVYAQCPPKVYQNCKIFTLFKPTDKNLISRLARNIGSDKKKLHGYFTLCDSIHDNITIDHTPGTPAPKRFNLVHEIEDSDDDEDVEYETMGPSKH